MNNIIPRLTMGIAKIKQVDAENEGVGLEKNVINIVNAVVGALGLVAVVIIVIGGVNYMTSSGDATKVKKAKDTILYGVIGLVVCALAFAIVNFVIAGVIEQGNTKTDYSKITTKADCDKVSGEWDKVTSTCSES